MDHPVYRVFAANGVYNARKHDAKITSAGL